MQDNILNPNPSADFILSPTGALARNAQGVAIEAAYREAERAHDALELSWAGAYVASLFQQHPWLLAMTITLSASAEYDDQGGTYRSVSNNVTDVVVVSDVTLPDEALDDGTFNPHLAANLIEESLEDSDYALYTSFNEAPYGYDDLCLKVNRDAIAHLFASGAPVSGTEAFLALFPEHTELLRADIPSLVAAD